MGAGVGAGAGRRREAGASRRDVSRARRPVVWKQLQVKVAPAAAAPWPAGLCGPSAPCCPAAARRGRARWPGSIRFLALAEPDSWVCDLGEERLWTWGCGGRGRGRPWLRRFPAPNSARSGAPAPFCEIKFSKHCLGSPETVLQIVFLSGVLLGTRIPVFLLMGVTRSGKTGGWDGKKKRL